MMMIMDPYQPRHNNSSESSSMSSEDAASNASPPSIQEGSSRRNHLLPDAASQGAVINRIGGGAAAGGLNSINPQWDLIYSLACSGNGNGNSSAWLSYNSAAAPSLLAVAGAEGPGSSSSSSSVNEPGGGGGRRHWAQILLSECGKAVCADVKPQVQQLMWMLNELSSPYGDYDQRLASYFLQALFCKTAGTGPRCYRILCSAAERSYSFDSMRKMILKFQDASPWTTFGHVASNGAILEAFEGEMKVHIVDISTTFCTQWPTLLESLATRPEGAPHLKLTTIILSMEASALRVMKEIGQRMEKFARLMGVPFEFCVLQQPELGKLEESDLGLDPDEALAINCNLSLHRVPDKSPGGSPFIRSQRDEIIATLKSMNPKIVTVTEEEADLLSTDFSVCFPEALRFYSLFFDSLEESFPRASNERLMLERSCARTMVNVLACEDYLDDECCNCNRLEKSAQWGSRFRSAGFSTTPLSDDVVDDVRALLKRYKEGWGLDVQPSGVFLLWKLQPAICTSLWKPTTNITTITTVENDSISI